MMYIVCDSGQIKIKLLCRDKAVSLILFLHLLFGLWFIYRIYHSNSYHILPQNLIKPCLFSYLILLLAFTQAPAFFMILGIDIPIIIWIATEWLVFYNRKKVFHSQFLLVLDSIIARMKTGYSFREALDLSVESIEQPRIKKDFTELKDRMIFSQELHNSSAEWLLAFQILKTVDQDLQPISRLQSIRHTLKIEQKFHAKANHVLLPIRTQSFVMIGLYGALLLFNIFYYDTQMLWITALSLFLFLTGTVFIFLAGRKIKWTL